METGGGRGKEPTLLGSDQKQVDQNKTKPTKKKEEKKNRQAHTHVTRTTLGS